MSFLFSFFLLAMDCIDLMKYLHSRGIAHNWGIPDNMLVNINRETREITNFSFLGFELSAMIDTAIDTQTVSVKNIPQFGAYLPAELIKSTQIIETLKWNDVMAGDIYTFGIVMYHLTKKNIRLSIFAELLTEAGLLIGQVTFIHVLFRFVFFFEV